MLGVMAFCYAKYFHRKFKLMCCEAFRIVLVDLNAEHVHQTMHTLHSSVRTINSRNKRVTKPKMPHLHDVLCLPNNFSAWIRLHLTFVCMRLEHSIKEQELWERETDKKKNNKQYEAQFIFTMWYTRCAILCWINYSLSLLFTRNIDNLYSNFKKMRKGFHIRTINCVYI